MRPARQCRTWSNVETFDENIAVWLLPAVLSCLYNPRVVDGKVMTSADLERMHKYLVESIDFISDEMRAVVESEWPELAYKLRGKKAEPGRGFQ